jgi:hypothetical protein
MPIRVAAGLVATVIEEAEHLPRRLTELPVTAVSQALQSAMRVQQKVTDLAIKGDRALGALRPVPETPTWARFDEDEEPQGPSYPLPRNGRLDPARGYPSPFDTYQREDPAEAYEPRPPKVTPVRILPDPDDAAEVPTPRGPDLVAEPDAGPAAAPEQTTPEASAEDGPPGLEGYEGWSLPQLRARFRSLSVDQLRVLLVWESQHRDRPPYVTMLGNRIASVTGQ